MNYQEMKRTKTAKKKKAKEVSTEDEESGSNHIISSEETPCRATLVSSPSPPKMT